MAYRVSRETVAKAVAALLRWMQAHAAKRKPQLLVDAGDDLVCLQASLRHIPDKSRLSPILLPLPHPLFDSSPSSSLSVCLIADDRSFSSSPSPATVLDRARGLGLPLGDAIGLSSLAADYRPYEARRRLCDSHDLFVADRRVIPLLPRILGKAFFEKKKTPLPIDMNRPGWPEQLRRLLRCTFLYLRSGTCCGLRVGRLSMDEEHIVDNIMAVIDATVEHVPKKWTNIRSLHLKSVDSVALPIYQAVPELGLKIDVPKTKDLDNVKERDEEEVMDAVLEGDGGVVKKRKYAGKKMKKAKLCLATRYINIEGDLVGGGFDEEDDGTDDKDGEKAVEQIKRSKRNRAKKDALEMGTGKEKKKKREKHVRDDTECVNEDNVKEDTIGSELGMEDGIKEKKKKKKEVGNAIKGKDTQQEDAGLLSFDEEFPTFPKNNKRHKIHKSENLKMKKRRSKMRT